MPSSMYEVLKRPIVTEKTNALRDGHNQFTFEVAKEANKIEVRRAVESIFGVRVVDVQTAIVRGKMRRTKRGYGKKPNWKRAIVTLHWEDQIELFEGV